MKCKKMHHLTSIYFVNQPLRVSGMFAAHQQEVFAVYLHFITKNIKMLGQQNTGY
jgi:hypothetical protein